MSSVTFSDRVVEHPESAAVRKVRQAVAELPGEVIHPTRVAAATELPLGKVESILFALAEEAGLRPELQVLDSSNRVVKTFERLVQKLPEIVETEMGDEVPVTPRNTRLAFRRGRRDPQPNPRPIPSREAPDPDDQPTTRPPSPRRCLFQAAARYFRGPRDDLFWRVHGWIGELGAVELQRSAERAQEFFFARYRRLWRMAEAFTIVAFGFAVLLLAITVLAVLGWVEVDAGLLASAVAAISAAVAAVVAAIFKLPQPPV